jgi:hypothetical protein
MNDGGLHFALTWDGWAMKLVLDGTEPAAESNSIHCNWNKPWDDQILTSHHLLIMQATVIDPRDATSFANLSLCLLKLREGERAVLAAQQCRKLRPRWAKAWYREGAGLSLLQVYIYIDWHSLHRWSLIGMRHLYTLRACLVWCFQKLTGLGMAGGVWMPKARIACQPKHALRIWMTTWLAAPCQAKHPDHGSV